MKAFDCLNLDFTLNVLKAIGIPATLVSWMQAYETNPMFSIALNGSLEGYFPKKKGLKQGYPLFCFFILSWLCKYSHACSPMLQLQQKFIIILCVARSGSPMYVLQMNL